MPISDVANRNFQSPLNFEFGVDRLTDFNYFIQKINIPDISIAIASNGGTNPFVRLPTPGDHIEFGELTVDFKVDEGMRNWYEIFSWMQGIGFPQSQEQYRLLKQGKMTNLDGNTVNLPMNGRKNGYIFGQAYLLINTSQNNPYLKLSFVDIHPVSLGEISFDTRETDVLYVTATVNFKYDYFTVEKIA